MTARPYVLRAAPPAALLCDMDGTLVDTEPAWSAAAGSLVREAGQAWTDDDDRAVVGWSIPRLVAHLQERGVEAAADEIATQLHERVDEAVAGALPWRPGARRLLAAAAAAGVPRALVTATHAQGTRSLLASLPADTFSVVVTGNLVSQPKPDPESYVRAAAALGVDPDACVAVEDSPTGIRAALGAGALTFAVDPTVRLPLDLASHDRLHRVGSLDAVREAVLVAT